MNPIETSPFKDSPIFWIQKIPSNWETKPVKRVMSLVADSVGSEWTSTELLSLTQNGVILRDMESGKGKFPADFSTYQLVCNDQLVMCLFDIDETPRTVGLARQSGMITGAYSVFSFIGDNNPRFFYYFFLWLDIGKALKPFYTGLRKVVRPGTFASLQVPVPPSHEQKIISIFLDREIAKIDALIAEQQRLIELLHEKRQVVISRAVSKGLNSNAPMKDSGVEWLGEVPEHWETGKIKHYFRTTSGSTPNSDKPELYYTTEEDEQGTPWIRTTDIDNDEVNAAVVFITPKALEDTACKSLPVNTVLVALYGGGGTVGKNGILKIEAAVNQALCGILPSPKALPEYVHKYIQFLRPFWMERAVSARKAGNISQELVGDTTFPIPPLQEQTAILRAIEEKLEELDELAKQSSESLVLLEERRSALISAAVTGQIDVRGLVEEEAGKQ